MSTHPRRSTATTFIALFSFVSFLGLMATPPVAADEYTLNVTATDGGDRYWFQIKGYPGENPTLSFAPGDEVTVRIQNGGTQPHNIHFGIPIAEGSDYLAPAETANFTFQIPGGTEPQNIQYWCDPHRQVGMVGTVLLGNDQAAGEDAELPHKKTPVAPLPYLILILAGLFALMHRRRPAR